MSDDLPSRHSLADFVVHELNPVLMALQMLSEQVPGADSRPIAVESAGHLRMLLEALPELGSGSLHPSGSEPLADAVAAARLFSGCRDCTEPLGGELAGLLVPAPHVRLILRNLLSNAAGHALPPVMVAAEMSAQGLRLQVRDGGPSGQEVPGMGVGGSIASSLAAAAGMQLSLARSASGSLAQLTVPLHVLGRSGPETPGSG